MTNINGEALQVCTYCGLTWRVPKPKSTQEER